MERWFPEKDWWEVASKAPVPGGDDYGTMFESEKADHFGQKHLYTKVQSIGLRKQNGASTILWSWGTSVPHSDHKTKFVKWPHTSGRAAELLAHTWKDMCWKFMEF